MSQKFSFSVFFHLLAYTLAFELYIKRLTLDSLTQSVTVVYDRPFTSNPQFGYAIQNISLQTDEANIIGLMLSNASLASCQIVFNISIVRAMLFPNEYIDIAIFFVNDPHVEIGTIYNGSLLTFPYFNQHKFNSQKSYSLSLFTNTIPCLLAVTNKNSTNFTISLGTNNGLAVVFTYVLVQKIFIATSIFIIFDQIDQISMDYYLNVDSSGYLMASDQNSFQGIMNLLYNDTIRLKKLSRYDAFDQGIPSIKIGFLPSSSNIINITAAFVNFNPRYTSCPLNSFLSYNLPFHSIPQGCKSCHSTCNTCTSSEQDSTYTDQRFCTTCPAKRQLLINPIYPYGECLCILGTVQSSDGFCIPCDFNCLDFNVYFLKSSTSSTFLLIFNFPDLNFEIEFEDNLRVYVDSKISNYTSKTSRRGVYKITLPSQDLLPCQQACQVTFKFLYPYKILHSGSYLTTQYRNLTIEDFYIVKSRLPKQLTQAFTITSLIISASSSTGQTSLIKMLFQLQQIIDVHKYLNLQIPVVFKQFVEALSSFKFLDLTTVISYDINSLFKSISIDELDCKGSPKIVYYQTGVNFYKNIIPVITSFFIILFLNFLIYLILRIIPLDFTRNIGEKIKIRWLITLSDMLETMALPVSLFAFSQLTYIIKKNQLIWVYMLSQLLCIFILLFPFCVISHTSEKLYKSEVKYRALKQQKQKYKKKQELQLQKQIAQDLLQDCSIDHRLTYIFYLYNYLRKFMFGIVLAQFKESGFAQGFTLLFVNLIQLCMMCYIIYARIFKSKAKIFSRSINLICITIIQSLIIGYNIGKNTLQQKILLGVTCTYLAMISTGLGIFQLFIKIIDVFCQATLNKNKKQIQNQNQNQKKEEIENINQNHSFIKNINNNIIKCQIAVDPLVFNFQEDYNSQQSSQNNNLSEIQYKQIQYKQIQYKQIQQQNKQYNIENNNKQFKNQKIRKNSLYRTTIYDSNSQNSQIAIIGSESKIKYEGLVESIYKRKNMRESKQKYEGLVESLYKRKNMRESKQKNILPAKSQDQFLDKIQINKKKSPDKDILEQKIQFKPIERKKKVRKQLNINNNILSIKKRTKKKLSFLQHQSSNSEIASIQQF